MEKSHEILKIQTLLQVAVIQKFNSKAGKSS